MTPSALLQAYRDYARACSVYVGAKYLALCTDAERHRKDAAACWLIMQERRAAIRTQAALYRDSRPSKRRKAAA